MEKSENKATHHLETTLHERSFHSIVIHLQLHFLKFAILLTENKEFS